MNNELIIDINCLINGLAKEIEDGAKEDRIVYHYTTYDGVLGILRDQNTFPVFYYSQYDCTNDSSEGYDLIDKYKNVLEILHLQNKISEELYSMFLNIDVNNTFTFFVTKPKINPFGGEKYDFTRPYMVKGIAYLCCFSTDGNCLPMWLNYCKAGLDKAYNIKLYISNIQNRSDAFRNGFIFRSFKVIYEDSVKEHYMEKLILGINDIINKTTKLVDDETIIAIQNSIISFLNINRFAFKYSKFDYEKEYRTVIVLPDERLGDDDIHDKFPIILNPKNKPCIEYEQEDSHLRGVYLGPSDLCEETKKAKLESLRSKLNARGLAYNCVFDYSRIPYRG